jgi:hypothetical protein
MRHLDRNLLNPDFVEFLQCLHTESVEAILVGGYAVVLHGYFRTTGDMDVWIRPTSENYRRMRAAFAAFGLPTEAISEAAFLDASQVDVFTFGRPPMAIDILTKVKGLDFDETFEMAEEIRVDDAPLRLIHLNHLKQAKRAADRNKDRDDLEHL